MFSVRNADWVTCILAIEKKLNKPDGIRFVGEAVMLDRIFVDYDDSKLDIAETRLAIEDAGYASYVTSNGSQGR